MTGVKVADASVLAAILFAEPEAERALERLGDAVLIEPPLLRYELTNVAWKAARRGASIDSCREALRLVSSLDIEWREVDHEAVLALAVQTGLTAYDASYLWLSRSAGAELVTFDKKLEAAAAKRPRGR